MVGSVNEESISGYSDLILQARRVTLPLLLIRVVEYLFDMFAFIQVLPLKTQVRVVLVTVVQFVDILSVN